MTNERFWQFAPVPTGTRHHRAAQQILDGICRGDAALLFVGGGVGDGDPGAPLPACQVTRAHTLPLPHADARFDVVYLRDLLAQLDDDDAAAAELYRVCRPGGTVVAFVPALEALWSSDDVERRHRRRYRLPELRALFRAAGFVEETSGYCNLVPCVHALVARALPGAGALSDPLFDSLLRLELALLRRCPLPLGSSAYFVGHKAAA